MKRVTGSAPRRGVALLLVLWLVVLLAAVTVAASEAARSSADLVAGKRAAATARSMAESGITVATAAIADGLHRMNNDSVSANAFLNSLDAAMNNGVTALANSATDTLGDGAFTIAIVDVNARLDVNEAGEVGFAKFLRQFIASADAQLIAERVARRVKGEGAIDSAEVEHAARDSISRVLLGRDAAVPRLRHPFESLDELLKIPGLDEKLLARISSLLTVDGNANINHRSAPAAVLAAAAGSVVGAPSRLLIIARGWQLGHPLTHEIQAVYDVGGTGLTLVRWRERTL